MAKADVVAAQKAAILAGQDQALESGLESVYDSGLADGVASVPPPDAGEQEKIDAAVAAAVAPLNSQIAQDASDLQAAKDAGVAALADLQKKLDEMTAKELAEEGVIKGLQDAVSAFQAVLSSLPQPQV